MEYLDIYDENGNHLGKEERGVVHRDALWHKTVHCWLFDSDGYVYFQRRKEEGTLYTTASGHIMAGETVEEGFAREIFEEIGYRVDYNKAVKLDEFKFVLDKVKKDGSIFKDRAMANIFACEFFGTEKDFHFDPNEVSGIVKVKADEALNLFETQTGEIAGFEIKPENGENIIIPEPVDFNEFLVNPGETAMGKYGDVLKGIIKLLKGEWYAKDKCYANAR